MAFSQQLNIVFEFQKTRFGSGLMEIDFRKKISPTASLFQSLQNVLFLVSVTLMQMSCCPLTNELSD
jgi:hypothetical protein